MTVPQVHGSRSLEHPGYWWYVARADLLRTALSGFLGTPDRVLDVGSADGPSVTWLREAHQVVSVDVDPRGLAPGEGVCASALALPFQDDSFDVVTAFDVVEHCDPERRVLDEFRRVLRPGGRVLLSVPAYQWAWSDHDVRSGHYRRYTRRRLVAAVEGAGFEVRRATYAFAGTFPLFAAERLKRRLTRSQPDEGLPEPSPTVEKVLLGLCRVDERLLRSRDLPFGSSVLLAAVRSSGS